MESVPWIRPVHGGLPEALQIPCMTGLFIDLWVIRKRDRRSLGTRSREQTGMDESGVYVVRVYRRDPAGMAGVVESVASGEQRPFHTNDELWRALSDLPSPRRTGLFSQPNEEGST